MSRMYCVSRGAGEPALVFVHGFTCAHTDWEPQLEHFAARHRVAACDLRAHGRTAGPAEDARVETFAADVAALVDEIGAARTVLIGHSLGCRIVLEAARRASRRIAGLVLVDGSMLGAGDPATVEQRVRDQMRAAGPAKVVAAMFAEMFSEHTPSAARAVISARANAFPEAIAEVLVARMSAWDANQMSDALAALAALPMLALQSTSLDAERKRVPLRAGESTPFLDALRRVGARIEVVPGVGHFTHLDAPALVNRHIERFIAEVA